MPYMLAYGPTTESRGAKKLVVPDTTYAACINNTAFFPLNHKFPLSVWQNTEELPGQTRTLTHFSLLLSLSVMRKCAHFGKEPSFNSGVNKAIDVPPQGEGYIYHNFTMQ